jgi:hypothetical protein
VKRLLEFASFDIAFDCLQETGDRYQIRLRFIYIDHLEDSRQARIFTMSDLERLSTTTWQRTDRPFLEIGRLERAGSATRLSGVALYRGRGGPSSVEYRIDTDADGCTRSAVISLDEPGKPQVHELTASGNGTWALHGEPLDLPFPCTDIDLAITPATNALAIRRLRLDVGATATARVLWVQIPSFTMRAVEQHYERIDTSTYRYKGRYGSYKITVDANGMVLDYPGGGWHKVAHKLSARG